MNGYGTIIDDRYGPSGVIADNISVSGVLRPN